MKKKFKKNKYKLKLKTKLKLLLILIIVILFFATYFYIIRFETQVVPYAISVSEKYATNIVSRQIDESIKETIEKMKLNSSNFFNYSIKNSENNFFDINTILINSVCNEISLLLSEKLNSIQEIPVEIPIGIFSGINAFSNVGPKFKIHIISVKDASIDYDTSFKSVGINQINFQVYLKINSEISIINPMYKKKITVSRKVTLVNTVFDGKVPNTYLNLPTKN